MSQDQPPKSNPFSDDELDDVWDSPTPDTTPAQRPSIPKSPPPQQPTSRSASSVAAQVSRWVNQASSALTGWSNQIRPELSKLSNKLQPVLATVVEKIRPLLGKLRTWWNVALPNIRRILPDSLNRQLSDRILTNIAIGLGVVLLWSLPGILLGKPTRVSQTPTTPPVPVVQPAPKPEIPAALAPITPPPPSNQPPAPPPPLDLTPAQSLIAAIQDQVAEVTNQYANGLIQSVQANFRSSRLIVKVGRDWYGLSSNRQDTLATEMQKRAQELGFNKLEITDAHETLLARSPVVGDVMIVLQREENVGSGEDKEKG
ncbi:MAG: hypothetical protein SFY66_17655 [Oculatellaceae cyanobacterium bins.114]|nr:hypothetical protein [Oculatellaceae cyanobacterium bins.114]